MAIDSKHSLQSSTPFLTQSSLSLFVVVMASASPPSFIKRLRSWDSLLLKDASQMTEGDLLGLPKVAKGVTTWCAPDWLAEGTKPVVLFLDEVDRATMEVRQGIFELCDSRKIAGHTLHKDTSIFACVNGGEHGSQYQVGEMDPAELDRYTVFDVEPSVEDWLAWAKGRIATEIFDFINHNHKHLEHNDDYEPNKVYPSRRSWERLSQTLSGLSSIENGTTLYHIATAFVGFEAAVASMTLWQSMSDRSPLRTF